MSTRVAVVGPTKAGKTVYLASLVRAATAPYLAQKPINVRPVSHGPFAGESDQRAQAILQGEPPAATQGVEQFDLWLDLPGSFWRIGEETLQLTIVDMEGGGCMPELDRPIPAEILSVVAQADALMVVVPANHEACPSDLDQRLSRLIQEVRGNSTSYSFQRLAVVMTMAELLVWNGTTGFIDELEKREAKKEITRRCEGLIRVVSGAVPRGGDWYSLVSAYGFHSEQGYAPLEQYQEYDPTSQKMINKWRLKLDQRYTFLEHWFPYRVFEPLEFLARGVCWREVLS